MDADYTTAALPPAVSPPSGTRARRSADRKPSSPDAVVAAVKARILEGRYLPGQRLLEAELCEEFGLSRGPVREAMTRLAGEGVIIGGPGRGSYVRSLSRTEAFDLLDVLEVLIALAARLAIVRCQYAANRQRLTEAYERLTARIAQGDSQALSIERTRFYDVLFAVAGNPELARAHPSMAAQILRAQVFPFVAQAERNDQYNDYQPLYQAIMDGDPKAATRIVESHLQRSRVHARHLPDEAFRA